MNFDGIVGPTHHYAGLGHGNLASQQSRHAVSNPRAAAIEGLAKMQRLHELGIPQAVLPPQERPDLAMLRRMGFEGTDADVLAAAEAELLRAASSASAMWCANAATVSPSADTADRRVHFTPANLVSQLHRSNEAVQTARTLHAIFDDPTQFAHHEPLPAAAPMADEGAANHMRLSVPGGGAGIEVFVYGRDGFNDATNSAGRFLPRQTRHASAAVARLHMLDAARTMLLQQNPDAIPAGVFHNDVIAVAHQDVLFCHALAYVNQQPVLHDLRRRFTSLGGELKIIEISEERLPLAEAVETYLFNSQIVTLSDGGMAMIAPIDCQRNPRTSAVLTEIIESGGPIRRVEFVEVRQSMRNGGGPACLRLRLPLTADQAERVPQGVRYSPALHTTLKDWISRHYRESLSIDDLRDPSLYRESCNALNELTTILGLPRLYRFQLH
jgi:succinylarginine dihydrolase